MKAYTVEKIGYAERGRTRYTFTEPNSKGEKIIVELTGCRIPVEWIKRGYVSEDRHTCIHVDVMVNFSEEDGEKACREDYNPTIDFQARKHVFDWIIEDTDANRERILEEISRRAFGE